MLLKISLTSGDNGFGLEDWLLPALLCEITYAIFLVLFSRLQLILASTLSEGWSSLLADIRSEVPLCLNHSILGDQAAQNQSQKQCRPLNAMQRFNLYPELILATLYRILFSFHLLPIQCYRVTRQLDGNPIAIVVSPSSFAKAIRNDRYHPYQQLSSPKKCQKFYPHTLSLDLQSLMFCVWVFIHKIVVSNINSSGRFL